MFQKNVKRMHEIEDSVVNHFCHNPILFSINVFNVDMNDRRHKALLHMIAKAYDIMQEPHILYVREPYIRRHELQKQLHNLLIIKRGKRRFFECVSFDALVNHMKMAHTNADEVGAFECIYNEWYKQEDKI